MIAVILGDLLTAGFLVAIFPILLVALVVFAVVGFTCKAIAKVLDWYVKHQATKPVAAVAPSRGQRDSKGRFVKASATPAMTVRRADRQTAETRHLAHLARTRGIDVASLPVGTVFASPSGHQRYVGNGRVEPTDAPLSTTGPQDRTTSQPSKVRARDAQGRFIPGYKV
jgi:hypothetical protein